MDFIKDLNIDKVRNLAEDAFNKVKPKTDVEARVYEVLSHENWGASTTLMNEIAQDTFDYERFLIVTKLMWEAIENQRPAAWRVIFKGLTLLEHLVKNGSERCVDDARNHSHLLRSLDKFNYYEGTVDRGIGVREKSKQLVEMLGDDERIREERMKARQLREKFAGRTMATSSSGAGAGGTKYAGYGNSDAAWASSGKGYGESGVGAAGRAPSNQAYAGRYGEEGVESTRSARPKPPGTSPKKSSKNVSSSTGKVKKVKKKEKKATEASAKPTAAEVDLFSFDAPSNEPPKAADDGFDAFQTATTPVANDDFGDFQEIAPSSSVQFDAFGTSSSNASQQASFDAFGASSGQYTNAMQQTSVMGGNQQMQSSFNAVSDVFGNMKLQNEQTTPAATIAANSAPPVDSGDDFGDFEGADLSSSKSPQKSSDPMSKLISLDGLTKNTKKEDKLSAPVVVNDAAAQYMQDQKQNPHLGFGNNSIGAQMTFQGIDGLGHTPDLSAKSKSNGSNISAHPIMGGGQPSEVGAKNISMMGPLVQTQGQGMGGMGMMTQTQPGMGVGGMVGMGSGGQSQQIGAMNQTQQGVGMGGMGGQSQHMGGGGMGMMTQPHQGMGMGGMGGMTGQQQQGFGMGGVGAQQGMGMGGMASMGGQQTGMGGMASMGGQQMGMGGMGPMGQQMGMSGMGVNQQGMGMGGMGAMGGQSQQSNMSGMGMGNQLR